MFCPRCNNPLEENATFCGACGAPMQPRRNGGTMPEMPDLVPHRSPQAVLAPTLYVVPQASRWQKGSTMVDPERRLPDKQSVDLPSTRDKPSQSTLSDTPRKKQKRTSRFFVFLAILTVVAIVIGGLSWFLLTNASFTNTAVTRGQVSFFDSQSNVTGTTDALRITATGLPNPPDGSVYDAWLIDATNEQILPLGSLSKSDSTTFALSYPNTSTQSRTNLVGAGNKVEVTQEQGDATEPGGKVVLSATFPPFAFIHVRHLLSKFPTTPGNIGLLTGLLRETQKVNALSLLLQNNGIIGNAASVVCLAQALVNVIEGNNGPDFSPLAGSCTNVVGGTDIGDGFGLLGNGGYIKTAAVHAALASSQSDTTDNIRQRAKDIEASTSSVNAVITQINSDVLQLVANPALVTSLVPKLVSLSDHAFHGFDQNDDGKIDPVVGEAGALTAYTSGQLMATLSLS